MYVFMLLLPVISLDRQLLTRTAISQWVSPYIGAQGESPWTRGIPPAYENSLLHW
eukprot:COSAG02_NODE_3746_length_6295_cov_35.811653_1_plen_55_part_00